MRVFFRSAPALVALSVALAGCNQSDPPGSTAGSSGASASTAAPADPSEYVLNVDGMV
jgi:hypothetical protein